MKNISDSIVYRIGLSFALCPLAKVFALVKGIVMKAILKLITTA